MGQIFSANESPGNQRNEQTKGIGLKNVGIEKDLNVIPTRKLDVEDCNVLPYKDVRNEKIQRVDSKDTGPSQIQRVDQKDEVKQVDQKDEEKHTFFQATGKYIPPLQRNKQAQEIDRKDEEKHAFFQASEKYIPPLQRNKEAQEIDRKDEEKHSFFEETGKYIPPFQRNKQAQEINWKDEEKHAVFGAKGKYMNKLQIPKMEQNIEHCPQIDDAIDKVDSLTNKQIFKDEDMMNDVSVRESLSVNKEILWLNHYNNGQTILLVEEGDFSFSASLAVAFGSSGSNITATSFDSSDFLLHNYKNAIANIEKLTCSGATIMHRLDAAKMAIHPYLRLMKFDRIIYNFPYFGLTKESPKFNIQKQKKQVRGFLSNAKKMIKANGEIHFSHKTNGFHLDWDVNELALLEGLCLVREVNFDPAEYPGYETKYGIGGDGNFNCNPCKTYMWRIVSSGLLR